LELTYHTLDVFTDRIFGGNPLAVFPDAEDLSSDLMQRIARELNLSETVFLSPPESEGCARRVRIFTPAMEVPFAGHPTVGTAFFLAASGAVDVPPEGGRIVLEENVGPVPVDVEMEGGSPVRTRLTAAVPPEHRPCPWSTEDLGALLSLQADAVGAPARGIDGVRSELTPELVSVGLPFVVVPVRDLAAARASRLDSAAWQRLTEDAWSRMIYVITTEAEGDDVDLHVRMFAPSAGVPEDPATGSAAAALGAYLGRRAAGDLGSDRAAEPSGGRGPEDGGRTLGWRVEQGLEMGRPSLLEVEADLSPSGVRAVRVGGGSVSVARGILTLP
jgi:trans-2,3-dihydro-3-hydroxyanthranilate isomerase